MHISARNQSGIIPKPAPFIGEEQFDGQWKAQKNLTVNFPNSEEGWCKKCVSMDKEIKVSETNSNVLFELLWQKELCVNSCGSLAFCNLVVPSLLHLHYSRQWHQFWNVVKSQMTSRYQHWYTEVMLSGTVPLLLSIVDHHCHLAQSQI